ncbi:MAG: hypothetical protein ACXWLH_02160 [Candidatus Saccharimonadales bacterium]
MSPAEGAPDSQPNYDYGNPLPNEPFFSLPQIVAISTAGVILLEALNILNPQG